MICPICNAQIPDESRFCPQCGNAIAGAPGPNYYEMFDRPEFKRRGWASLRSRYWYGFLVCLIMTLVAGVTQVTRRFDGTGLFGWRSHYVFPPVLMGILFIASLAGIIYYIFVVNPFEAGEKRYFISNQAGGGDVGDILYSFRNGHYFEIVGAQAWRMLFTFLWSLLFIIPGIVKSIAYCLVPYILAENPYIGYDRALKLSMRLTKGYKGDIFILYLSFIGWYLLGALCFGVGVLFVNPYLEATLAEMYVVLRDNAVKQGLLTYEELYRHRSDPGSFRPAP